MQKPRFKIKMNLNYILWGTILLLFLVFMINQYCKMVYGGGTFYVFLGKNEITQEEKAYLKQQRGLVYGETLDSFPAQIYDPLLKGEKGFAIDLMNQLALEMETNITFHPLLWPNVFEELDSGQVDIIQISYSEGRDEKYYLTAPIYKSRGVVFLRNTREEIKYLEDLQGKKIAGIEADYGLSVLKKKFPELEILEYSSISECAQALKEQKVDGMVADEQNIMYYAQEEKMFQNYYIVEEEVYKEDVVFAVRKEDKKLGEILNKAVYTLRTNDILNKLQQKWFLSSVLEDALPRQKIYIWVVEFLAGIILSFVYLFSYIHHRTKKIVELRTSELDQERRKMKTILDSLPQYLFEVTSEGIIQMYNQQVQKDIQKKEIPFCDVENMIINQECIMDMLEEIPYHQSIQKELEIEQKWFRVTCSNICGICEKTSGDHVIILIEDITISRLQERQNIQNDKMAAIGQLASGISHELKNPLEIICNYCYALKKGILQTKEDVLQTIDVIEEEAKDANKIVESLLSFARTVPKEVCETELKPCVQMLLQFQAPLMKKKNIEIQFQCEDGIFVRCNPEEIKRIIINLLTNAEDAIEQNGGMIKITAVKETEYVKIEFRDNGKGMSQQEIEKIFNPFYTTKSSGTGLGLYLVYCQIEENNGSIQVYSKEKEGTLFTIYLPVQEK